MKFKKKYIAIISIILIMAFLLVGVRHYWNSIVNLCYNIRMIGVDKDITITKLGGNIELGGYASSTDYYYIDINKKKIYKVELYHIWSEDESMYYLKKTKKLNDETIKQIIELAKLESDYKESSNKERIIRCIIINRKRNSLFS